MALSAQVRCPASGALDEAQLTEMVKDAAREPRARLFIAACGVTFPMNAETEKRLRAAGATENTILLLLEKAPSGVKAPAPTLEKQPEPAQTKPTIAPGTPRKGADGLEYAWIPPGTFQMGCATNDRDCTEDEKPRHEVRITKGFWMEKVEVTQAAYQRVIGADPSYFKGLELPVEKVSWAEAQAYCKKVQGRLPTEAEWEYAARAGGSGGGLRLDGAGSDGSHYLSKMLGTVWVWVGDWYDDKYYQHTPVADPSGPATGQYRGLRGGVSGDEDPRVSTRGKGLAGFLYYNVGFRCVREAIP